MNQDPNQVQMIVPNQERPIQQNIQVEPAADPANITVATPEPDPNSYGVLAKGLIIFAFIAAIIYGGAINTDEAVGAIMFFVIMTLGIFVVIIFASEISRGSKKLNIGVRIFVGLVAIFGSGAILFIAFIAALGAALKNARLDC